MTTESRPPDDAADNGAPEPADDFVSRLLDREPPEAYLEAWTRSLKRRLGEDERGTRISLGIFRVAEELFALATDVVVEVQPTSPIRSVPGRTGEVFRGLVSLRGEIHLCASLRALFGLGAAGTGDESSGDRRLLVVERAGERWALVVDEVLDFERFDADAVQGAQVTVSKAAVHFSDGVLQSPRGQAAVIDPKRLFEGLARSLA
jgi:chemotaxis-related protein WspD